MRHGLVPEFAFIRYGDSLISLMEAARSIEDRLSATSVLTFGLCIIRPLMQGTSDYPSKQSAQSLFHVL